MSKKITKAASPNNDLKKALEHHKACLDARDSVEEKKTLALYHAYQAGVFFNRAKEALEHGEWLPWLQKNVCKPNKVSERTIRRYTQLVCSNPGYEGKTLQQFVKSDVNVQFGANALAKLWGNETRALTNGGSGDEPANVIPYKPVTDNLLSLVNEWHRIKNRLDAGHIKLDWKQAREDFRPVYEWAQRELYGDVIDAEVVRG